MQFTIAYREASRELGYCLAFHCAPAIAGIKIANLVSLQKTQYQTRPAKLESILAKRGIHIAILRQWDDKLLLLIYNKPMLESHLRYPENRQVLARCGYEKHEDLESHLRRLSQRIQTASGEYPHEIGVFLGYPHEDVQGFIRHRGQGYKLSGYWKVYGDPGRAKQLFHAYDAVRDYFCHRVSKGEQIHTIQYGGHHYEQSTCSVLVGNR